MPAGAVKIDRTTKWGNPFRIEKLTGELPWTVTCTSWPARAAFATEPEARAFSVGRHRRCLFTGNGLLRISVADVFRELTEVDFIACWCGLEELCHGDNYLAVLAHGDDPLSSWPGLRG